MSETRPKIALALGSGAARGLAHIGVLKVLEKHQIPVDFIAGTSIGAALGALYAAGVSVLRMEEVMRDLDWRALARLLDPTLPTSGLIDGNRVATFFDELLPVATFEELNIPLAITATDIETGEALVIRKGNLREGLRAAVAFPGIFTPVPFGDRFLVDGGLINPVPLDVAHQMGADRVIGVCTIPGVQQPSSEAFLPAQTSPPDAPSRLRDYFTAASIEKLLRDIWTPNHPDQDSPPPRNRKPPNIFSICSRSVAIMENRINALQLDRIHADVFIRPRFDDLTMLEFHRAPEAIAAGEKAAHEVLPQLHALRRA
ncbi:patatin-like phospholipase family protein [Syntrophotalea carbinolica]|nr:patatin-like phospholipase family protein [Syntrophotalea carbinolica]